MNNVAQQEEEKAVKTEQAKSYTQAEVDEIVRKAIRQERELMVQVMRGMPDFDATTKQGWIENPQAVSTVLSQGFSPFISDSKLDTIVRVDRSVRPVYPDWVKMVMHPELEKTGPTEYDLAKAVDLWFHDDRKIDLAKGSPIYQHLGDTETLKTCLGLRDGEEIKKKGIAVFRKIFGGNVVFLWKSVVHHHDGGVYVPGLCEHNGSVVMDWHWTGSSFVFRPVVRFRK